MNNFEHEYEVLWIALDNFTNVLAPKLASFKEEQLPYHSQVASQVGAAVLAHVARSGRSDAALR